MSACEIKGYDYLRVRIRCELRTESPLHCGDGSSLSVSESPWAERKGGEGHINTLCRTAKGPYIPASTLRGSLRERCREPQALFGEARGDTGAAGAVRIYDAFFIGSAPPVDDNYYNPEYRTTLRDGVSLDPVTGTAAEGRLFTFEIVPAGSVFEVMLEADRLTETQLTELLGLLGVWNGTATGALGKGRTRGWGRVRLHGPPQVSVLTDADIRTWATDSGESPPRPRSIDPPAKSAVPLPAAVTFGFSLHPDSPLLVNEPARVQPKVGEDDYVPDLEYMRDPDGAAVVPGSSLRGALRGRARRILATIAHRHHKAPAEVAGETVEPLVGRVFGTEGRRSPLWIGDARAAATKAHEQHFNAVDRFTGGVAAGALYAVRAADCARLDGEAALDLPRLPEGDWWKGLLLLLARDLLEGDIPVGWGKSRGFGSIGAAGETFEGQAISDFPALLRYLRGRHGEAAPQAWMGALHRAVAEAAADEQIGASR